MQTTLDVGGFSMDFDALFDGMTGGDWSLTTTTASFLRFTDGEGNVLRLNGSFSIGSASVDSILYFEDSVRTARITADEPFDYTGPLASILEPIVPGWIYIFPCVMAGGKGGDRLTGSDFDDVLDGRGGSDALRGAGGGDRLLGKGGNDHLDGQDGDDVLIGGAGNDVLIGGAGSNRATGGAGVDLFIADAQGGTGVTRVNDFGATDVLGWIGMDKSSPTVRALSDVFEFADTLADLSSAQLASVGLKANQNAGGHAVVIGGDQRLVLRDTLLEEIELERVLLTSDDSESLIEQLGDPVGSELGDWDFGLGFADFGEGTTGL